MYVLYDIWYLRWEMIYDDIWYTIYDTVYDIFFLTCIQVDIYIYDYICIYDVSSHPRNDELSTSSPGPTLGQRRNHAPQGGVVGWRKKRWWRGWVHGAIGMKKIHPARWCPIGWVYPLVMTNIANWKDPLFFMEKSTISMAIFNSYVSLPEGIMEESKYIMAISQLLT